MADARFAGSGTFPKKQNLLSHQQEANLQDDDDRSLPYYAGAWAMLIKFANYKRMI